MAKIIYEMVSRKKDKLLKKLERRLKNMEKRYPMTYEEYEQKIKELYMKNKKNKEDAINRFNTLLENDSEFIKGLYAETCFRYDHPEIYSETCKKVFGDYLLESIPVTNLDMLLGGKID